MNIENEIRRYLLTHDIINVVIAGTTCSGKTTLANEIRKNFSEHYSVCIVSQDDYFKNLHDIPRAREGYLTDSLDAFHTVEFKHDVSMLLQNGVVTMPRYDVATNTRISKNKIVRSGKINIFEGLHTIHLLGGLDNSIMIYLDTRTQTCLERRIHRDSSKYGVPEQRIRQYWNDVIYPMCEKFIFPQKEMANIIISREGGEFNDS